MLKFISKITLLTAVGITIQSAPALSSEFDFTVTPQYTTGIFNTRFLSSVTLEAKTVLTGVRVEQVWAALEKYPYWWATLPTISRVVPKSTLVEGTALQVGTTVVAWSKAPKGFPMTTTVVESTPLQKVRWTSYRRGLSVFLSSELEDEIIANEDGTQITLIHRQIYRNQGISNASGFLLGTLLVDREGQETQNMLKAWVAQIDSMAQN